MINTDDKTQYRIPNITDVTIHDNKNIITPPIAALSPIFCYFHINPPPIIDGTKIQITKE